MVYFNKDLKTAPNNFAKKRTLRGFSRISHILSGKKKDKENEVLRQKDIIRQADFDVEQAEMAKEHSQVNFGNQWGEEGSSEAEAKMTALENEAEEARNVAEATKVDAIDRVSDNQAAVDEITKAEKYLDYDDLINGKGMDEFISESKTGLDAKEMRELDAGMRDAKVAYNVNAREAKEAEKGVASMRKRAKMERAIEHDLEMMGGSNPEEIHEQAKQIAKASVPAPSSEQIRKMQGNTVDSLTPNPLMQPTMGEVKNIESQFENSEEEER